ncbi:AraC family transcriptional regulator [Pelagibacterium flavum]|uniref:AraC family transcriptional regulator n=2 Tax=Pelagibacterium flavum TaxID=2984530 RepID=A0ABY6INS4_9HYPH|nr:AraC family transcriptional regulator [Pelagibacterium sp. YIM 151497]UYQ71094.1 AraC family transcriptional regulator [Pelagibacterium sp. YIM 151497]
MNGRPNHPGLMSKTDEGGSATAKPRLERRRWERKENSDGDAVAMRGPPVLKPLEFSTRDMPNEQQFGAWQSYMEAVAEYRLPDGKAPADGFPAEHVAWNLGGALIVQLRVAAHSYWRSTAKLRASPIDHWRMAILRSGRSWTEVDGHVAQNEPGKVEFRTLGHPSRGRMTDAEAVLIYLPRDLFGDSATVLDDANNVVLSDNLSRLLIDYVSSLEASLPSLVAEDLPGIVGMLRDMVITSLSSVEHKHTAEHHGVGLMERARRYIRQNLDSPDLTPESLCQELATSRTRLYQLFESSGGVLHYIRRKRLLASHAALCDPANQKLISEIAEATGFDSPANFSRAFKLEFGYSPREAREHAAAEHAAYLGTNTSEDTKNFSDWLAALGR